MDRETETLRHLMEVGRGLLAELDPDKVFTGVLHEARLVTGARYAALGVLSADRTELSRFLTSGISAEQTRVIGDLPRGRGVLGVLIDDPRPLRLADVGAHPHSFGLPAGHPQMSAFLGVPVKIRGQAWGNLYLSEKEDGSEFTQDDEDAVGVLAQFAATAIENARLYQQAESGRRELAQAVRGLEAARAISDAIGAEADLETILELIVKRGRALVNARSVMIMLAEGDRLVYAAGTGRARVTRGMSMAIAGTSSGRALLTGVPLRVDNVPANLQGIRDQLGITDVRNALIVPMTHRGDGIGVLVVLDRGPERLAFTDGDQALMQTFASSAANAVAISHSVEAERLAATIDAAEDERRRWARELHDQTLQSLGGLRMLLSEAKRRDQLDGLRDAVDNAVTDLEDEIRRLRAIIADLRPPLLDDLGLADALGALIDRHRDAGLGVSLSFSLEDEAGVAATLAPELETTVYRLVQESLTNVVKHAQAETVEVRVRLTESRLVSVEVADDGVAYDGVAYDAEVPTAGSGLTGIRERVYLTGGTIHFTSTPGSGTTMRATLPAAGRAFSHRVA